jgi:hypothetical protein
MTLTSIKKLLLNGELRRWLVPILGVCLVLAGLLQLQGPRIRRVLIEKGDDGVVIELQDLTLEANVPLAKAMPDLAVSFEPATPLSVSYQNKAITIKPNVNLLYDTTYTVKVTGLVDYRGRKGRDYNYTFRTRPASMVYLERNHETGSGSDTADRVIRKTPGQQNEQTLFNSLRIKQFALSPAYLAIVVSQTEHEDNVFVQHVDKNIRSQIELPKQVVVNKLVVSKNQDLFALIVTSTDTNPAALDRLDNNLFLFDARAGVLQPVKDLDGLFVKALDVSFAPDGSTLLYQTADSSLFLKDTARPERAAVALGQALGFYGFDHSGTRLLMQQNEGVIIYNLTTKERTTLPASIALGNQTIFGHNSDHLLLSRLRLPFDSLTANYQVVWADLGTNERVLYSEPNSKTTVVGINLSPNDHFVSYEHADRTSPFDNYGLYSKPKEVMTDIIELETGKKIETIRGSSIQWL